jgi:hypothetical protein
MACPAILAMVRRSLGSHSSEQGIASITYISAAKNVTLFEIQFHLGSQALSWLL